LRWQRTPSAEVHPSKAYLSAVVTRLRIDQLRSARVRRAGYVGPWLPEPLLTERDVGESAVLDERLSMAFLVLLDSLTPAERAVFVLRDIFDYEYAEISRLVGKSEANCCQIARRAREFIAARRRRFESSPEQEESLTQRFLEACLVGDMERLLALLSEDVTLYSDGGGKTRGTQPDPRSREGRPLLVRDAGQGSARVSRPAGPGQRAPRPRRLLWRWKPLERRDPRGRGRRHPGHPPRRQPGEAG
jgi:RNA polymerase sigma-70 factor (ECF subfamily)